MHQLWNGASHSAGVYGDSLSKEDFIGLIKDNLEPLYKLRIFSAALWRARTGQFCRGR